MEADTPEDTEVCPARAGMIRIISVNAKRCRSLPRTRGDDPKGGHHAHQKAKFAPHARG